MQWAYWISSISSVTFSLKQCSLKQCDAFLTVFLDSKLLQRLDKCWTNTKSLQYLTCLIQISRISRIWITRLSTAIKWFILQMKWFGVFLPFWAMNNLSLGIDGVSMDFNYAFIANCQPERHQSYMNGNSQHTWIRPHVVGQETHVIIEDTIVRWQKKA